MTSVGTVFADRYTLLREAWRSEKGPVWHARDETLGRRVHVLVLDDRFSHDRAQRKAFIDDGTRAAAIADSSLVSVYDIGTDPPFVVFEDPGGGRLSERLRSGPLETTSAASVAANIARAVQALESREEPIPQISAETVLLSSDGRAKLSPLTARDSKDPRRELASLTALVFTGDEPTGDRIGKGKLPRGLGDLCSRMLVGEWVSLDAFVDQCGALTRPAPLKGERPTGESRRTDVGWLVGVVVIVLLAVAAVVLGPQLIEQFGDRGGPEPAPTEQTQPRRTALDIDSISDFDPEGSGEERSAQVPNAVDGDPDTRWTTLGYRQVTMNKSGVGLLIDLGDEARLQAVRITTSLPGWTAEIRVGTDEPSAADDLESVARFTADPETNVALPRDTEARFVLVWIIRLADDPSDPTYPFRAAIDELVILS